MSNELSPADIMAMNGNNDQWSNPFIYLVWLAVLGGGGLFGNRGSDPAVQGAITRSDLFEGFNNQDVNGQLRGITNGLSDGFYAINNGLRDGFYGVKDGICCTNRNIDAVRYDLSTAIHAEGEATRALINANAMQDLRDRLEARDREILARDFQLSQLSQNQYLINEIRPCAKPAYLTCSPYTASTPFGGCCNI